MIPLPSEFNNETGIRPQVPPKKSLILPICLAAAGLLLLLLVFVLSRCRHTWLDATCTDPETCSRCGATRAK